MNGQPERPEPNSDTDTEDDNAVVDVTDADEDAALAELQAKADEN